MRTFPSWRAECAWIATAPLAEIVADNAALRASREPYSPHNSPWTLAHDKQLLELCAAGLAFSAIADRIGRTAHAVQQHYWQLARAGRTSYSA